MTEKPWPKAAGQAPTADQIARALVLASEFTGERERLVQAALDGTPLQSVALRCRSIAIAALNENFPKVRINRLGEILGLAGPSGQAAVLHGKRTTWWPTQREFDKLAVSI